ncbi:hypothetical protein HY030_02835 [Candidatus Gottesmanbacteria bacterium]|nr:hypothetical protein [Candidatus Gottesmanbacteria bacterium]
MKQVNVSKLIKKYTSGWISLSSDQKKVIAHGKSLQTVLKRLKELGNPSGYLIKATKDYSYYN